MSQNCKAVTPETIHNILTTVFKKEFSKKQVISWCAAIARWKEYRLENMYEIGQGIL